MSVLRAVRRITGYVTLHSASTSTSSSTSAHSARRAHHPIWFPQHTSPLKFTHHILQSARAGNPYSQRALPYAIAAPACIRSASTGRCMEGIGQQNVRVQGSHGMDAQSAAVSGPVSVLTSGSRSTLPPPSGQLPPVRALRSITAASGQHTEAKLRSPVLGLRSASTAGLKRDVQEKGGHKKQRSVQVTLTGGRRSQPVSATRGQKAQGVAAKGGRSVVPEGLPGVTDLGHGALITYRTAVWSPADAIHMLADLQTQVGWEHREVRIMGRMLLQPRLIAYQGDSPSLRYTYSGLQLTPEPWSPCVLAIKEALESISGTTFDSCLLNLYRDGSDHMGWHADNEQLYGPQPVIGSVSFGARRDFMLRCNADRTQKLRYPLGAGDVLVMSGSTQDLWTHSIPKRANADLPRINLTFRKVVHRQD